MVCKSACGMPYICIACNKFNKFYSSSTRVHLTHNQQGYNFRIGQPYSYSQGKHTLDLDTPNKFRIQQASLDVAAFYRLVLFEMFNVRTHTFTWILKVKYGNCACDYCYMCVVCSVYSVGTMYMCDFLMVL